MTARIYVGTYAKYNSGSIAGAWLNLDDYADKDAFMEACAKLHANEPDPELMFQDVEGFPKGLAGESWVKPELWDWLAMDDDDRELLSAYQEHVDQEGTIEQAHEALLGRGDSTPEDFVAQWLDDTGGLEGMPAHLRNYFDYEAYARDMACDGVVFARHEGELWVFHPC